MVTVGTGSVGTRFVDEDYPVAEGLTAGTTKHLEEKEDETFTDLVFY